MKDDHTKKSANKNSDLTDDRLFESHINSALDDSVENLSPEIRRKLNQIRIKAAQNKTKSIPLWKTASAFSVLLAVLLSWQMWPDESAMPLTPFADVLEEDLDMLDDLEFVYWMVEDSGMLDSNGLLEDELLEANDSAIL